MAPGQSTISSWITVKPAKATAPVNLIESLVAFDLKVPVNSIDSSLVAFDGKDTKVEDFKVVGGDAFDGDYVDDEDDWNTVIDDSTAKHQLKWQMMLHA